MTGIVKLECDLEYVDIAFENFHMLVSESLIKVANPDRLSYDELKFFSQTNPDLDNIKSIDEVRLQGIPIFDYFIYKSLNEPTRFSFSIKSKVVSESPLEYLQSIFSLYFILMTRGKPTLSDDETLPKFLSDYMRIKLTWADMLKNLSSNDITKIDHQWIKRIDVNSLPKAIRQRLASGIAGSRLFNVFSNFMPARYADLLPQKRILFNILRKLSTEGPYLEMHPMFMPSKLASLSISRNLRNFIIDVYSKEEVITMVRNKVLYDQPVFDSRYRQYETWDESTFEDFKTKIISE